MGVASIDGSACCTLHLLFGDGNRSDTAIACRPDRSRASPVGVTSHPRGTGAAREQLEETRGPRHQEEPAELGQVHARGCSDYLR